VGGGGGGKGCLYSYQMTCSHFLIIAMIIGCPCHIAINHGCHINEIKMMKTDPFHLVNFLSFTSHMPH
jgi:hypothetical protein